MLCMNSRRRFSTAVVPSRSLFSFVRYMAGYLRAIEDVLVEVLMVGVLLEGVNGGVDKRYVNRGVLMICY